MQRDTPNGRGDGDKLGSNEVASSDDQLKNNHNRAELEQIDRALADCASALESDEEKIKADLRKQIEMVIRAKLTAEDNSTNLLALCLSGELMADDYESVSGPPTESATGIALLVQKGISEALAKRVIEEWRPNWETLRQDDDSSKLMILEERERRLRELRDATRDKWKMRLRDVPALACDIESAYAQVSNALDVLRERTALGLTQQQLAKQAGVRSKTLVRLESGKYSPNVQAFREIKRALQDEKRRAKLEDKP